MYWQAIEEALESLSANKMRSGLTMLGIIIGVAAVIAVLAIGSGASDSILGQIEGIGSNLIFVTQTNDSEVRNPKPLTLADAEAIADPFAAPSVLEVAPSLQGNAEVSYYDESKNTTVLGVTPKYAVVRNVDLIEGSFIDNDQISGNASVVVLGYQVADDLFARTDGLVGETVRVEGQPYRVIGVMAEKGGSSFNSEDDQILVPLTSAQIRLINRPTHNQVDLIYVQAVDADAMAHAQEEIAAILRSRHRSAIGLDDFTIFTQQAILDVASTVTGVMTIFLGGIAAISLLVGGIGIMNIMLVSVVERTKEIGLRKALGARKLDILAQFLIESSLLSLVGGLLGIAFGWMISFAVGQIAARSSMPLNPVVNLNGILLATLFSAAVGLFFGLYPANRAANLEPVEALRSE
jgi:putative ABC transport system permease protein